ncbi:MAG: hypothetical protein HYY17_05430 [Planctomycetes bacterium]|nr:hypothetical protein [Planctomycetota bacterium]
MKRLAIAFLLLLPAPARTQESSDEAKLKEEIRTLEQRVLAWGAMRRVGVTDAQARPLLDLVKKAAIAKADYDAAMAKLRDEQLRAFRAFRQEDFANIGFTPKVEQAAGRADHEEKVLFKKLADRIEAMAKESPLTEDQAELLALFRPENPGSIFAKRDPGPLPDALANFVRKLRRLTDAEFERQKDALREEFLRAIDARAADAKDMVKVLQEADEAMKQIRALPEDRVLADVPKIVRKARPKAKAENLRDELGDIHKQKYGQIGPVGRFLLLPALGEALAKRLGVKADLPPTASGAPT